MGYYLFGGYSFDRLFRGRGGIPRVYPSHSGPRIPYGDIWGDALNVQVVVPHRSRDLEREAAIRQRAIQRRSLINRLRQAEGQDPPIPPMHDRRPTPEREPIPEQQRMPEEQPIPQQDHISEQQTVMDHQTIPKEQSTQSEQA